MKKQEIKNIAEDVEFNNKNQSERTKIKIFLQRLNKIAGGC